MSEFDYFSVSEADRLAFEDPTLFNNEEEFAGLCSDTVYADCEGYPCDYEESFVDFDDYDDYDQTLHRFDYGYREPSTNRSSKQVVTQTERNFKQVDTQTKRNSKHEATQTEHNAMEAKCQVCFEFLFERIHLAMTTECGHIFCKTCLDQVLKIKKECPVCRGTIYRGFRLYF